ncbi:MAG TPA: hypothetical protein VGX25_30420 [Actinophytocola sp.]|uniref:hypothetical protein n=1 Tax=Actinophytocola sp. TaxID=1872138 RepID=UPI002DDD5C26|nr:hypothetical protein [Actinophytocola sp.]HEV2783724.1 hypothetical protein [Actinophytocola sp.]
MRRSLLSRWGIVIAVLALALPGGVARADSGPGYGTAGCWQPFPVPAQPAIHQLAHGGDGSIWASMSHLGGVGRWNGSGWTMFPGVSAGTALAVTPAGQPWVVAGDTNIYRLVGTVWEQVPGRAVDLDIGHFGTIWKTGPEIVDFGFSLHVWRGTEWQQIEPPRPTGANFVTVDIYGTPWVTNHDKMYRRKTGIGGGSWGDVGTGGWWTLSFDIGGYNNPVYGEQLWRIAYDGVGLDHPIQRLDLTRGWVFVEGEGRDISVDRDGRAWHLNSSNQVYYWVCA